MAIAHVSQSKADKNYNHMATATPHSKIFQALKENFGYTNVMQAPKVVKIVVSGFRVSRAIWKTWD